jgi:hypothetical protein
LLKSSMDSSFNFTLPSSSAINSPFSSVWLYFLIISTRVLLKSVNSSSSFFKIFEIWKATFPRSFSPANFFKTSVLSITSFSCILISSPQVDLLFFNK